MEQRTLLIIGVVVVAAVMVVGAAVLIPPSQRYDYDRMTGIMNGGTQTVPENPEMVRLTDPDHGTSPFSVFP